MTRQASYLPPVGAVAGGCAAALRRRSRRRCRLLISQCRALATQSTSLLPPACASHTGCLLRSVPRGGAWPAGRAHNAVGGVTPVSGTPPLPQPAAIRMPTAGSGRCLLGPLHTLQAACGGLPARAAGTTGGPRAHRSGCCTWTQRPGRSWGGCRRVGGGGCMGVGQRRASAAGQHDSAAGQHDSAAGQHDSAAGQHDSAALVSACDPLQQRSASASCHPACLPSASLRKPPHHAQRAPRGAGLTSFAHLSRMPGLVCVPFCCVRPADQLSVHPRRCAAAGPCVCCQHGGGQSAGAGVPFHAAGEGSAEWG